MSATACPGTAGFWRVITGSKFHVVENTLDPYRVVMAAGTAYAKRPVEANTSVFPSRQGSHETASRGCQTEVDSMFSPEESESFSESLRNPASIIIPSLIRQRSCRKKATRSESRGGPWSAGVWTSSGFPKNWWR